MVLVSDTLMLKGEDEKCADDLMTAKAKLLTKMNYWSSNYRGAVGSLLSSGDVRPCKLSTLS